MILRVRTIALVGAILLSSDTSGAAGENLGAKVKSGVDRALAAKSQEEVQAAFDSIVQLGCPAAPEIVDRMDDRRELPVPYIRLANDSPQAFEAFRQYGPEVVVDALAAILNDITVGDCGFIFNGAPEAKRAEAVECWRKFVRETPVKNCGRK